MAAFQGVSYADTEVIGGSAVSQTKHGHVGSFNLSITPQKATGLIKIPSVPDDHATI